MESCVFKIRDEKMIKDLLELGPIAIEVLKLVIFFTCNLNYRKVYKNAEKYSATH